MVRARQGSGPGPAEEEEGEEEGEEVSGAASVRAAMANARKNLAEGTSPGAGLASSEDQANAAFADMLVVSSDNARVGASMGRGGLSDAELEELGGTGASMEAAADAQKGRSRGLVASLVTLANVLAKGGTVRRDEYRR